jgi:hypothetical protein
MEVDDEEARMIRRESAATGNILNGIT